MSPKLIDEDALRAREATILDAAQTLLNKVGATALTMDKVVAQVPFSKGTVYNHFSSKEDLLIGLCNESMQSLVSMFRRALSVEACSRDRMLAVGFAYMLYAYLYPDKFMLVITAKTPSVTDKASPARQAEHLELENMLLEMAATTILEGLDAGELELPADMPIDALTFAFWSSAFGTISLLSEKVERCATRESIYLEQAIVMNCNLLLDGLNWQPRSDAARTSGVIKKLKETIFVPEMELIAQQNKTLNV